jgi:MarR family transcriptional regulator, transcriptional regulator for hemolysin
MRLAHSSDEAPFPDALDALVFRFEDVPRQLRRLLDAALESYGLSRTQWRLLAYVFRQDGLTQSELARLLELERATVGQVIDVLEAKRLIARRPIPSDRRVWAIGATAEARALLPELRRIAAEISTQLFRGFDEADLATLRSLLERLNHNLAG